MRQDVERRQRPPGEHLEREALSLLARQARKRRVEHVMRASAVMIFLRVLAVQEDDAARDRGARRSRRRRCRPVRPQVRRSGRARRRSPACERTYERTVRSPTLPAEAREPAVLEDGRGKTDRAEARRMRDETQSDPSAVTRADRCEVGRRRAASIDADSTALACSEAASTSDRTQVGTSPGLSPMPE